MKNLAKLFLVICLVFVASGVYAYTQTQNITVKVIIQKLSVSVSPSEYDFGGMTENSSEVATSSITVTNDGNYTEKFKMDFPSGEPNGTWNSVTASAPGAEEYRLSAIFKDVAPVTDDYLASDSFCDGCARTATTTDLARDGDADSVKGLNVSATQTRGLWFKFEAPSTTAITTQQSITTSITALAD
jgi:hypothetical protein